MQTAVTIDPACGIDPRIGPFGCLALDIQAQELAAAWSIPYVPVVYYSWDVLLKLRDDDEVAKFVADVRLMTIQPIIDAPGASGFHDDVAGVIFSRVLPAVDPLDWTTPSHENCEMTVDAPCDKYAPLSPGKQQAVEVCDRCEGDSYGEDATIGEDSMLITLSDYLLPTAFQPGSTGPWDRMERLKAWDEVRPQGYEIVMDAAGNTTNVFARVGRIGVNGHAALAAKLQRGDSRTMRRLRGAWAP